MFQDTSPNQNQQQYLPSYLLGSSQITTTTSPFKNISPSHKSRLLIEPPQQQAQPPCQLNTPNDISSSKSTKQGAPPVAGLYDNISQSPYCALEKKKLFQQQFLCNGNSFNNSFNQQSLSLNQSLANDSLNLSAGLSSTHTSLAKTDRFQGASITGEDTTEYNNWVTVFGFPSSALSGILEQFSQLGTIIRHVTVPNSNWLHLRYPSQIQAQLALSKNGKIFSSNIMIGVQPCVDLSVMNASLNDVTTTTNNNTSFTSHTTPIRAFNSACKIPIGDVSQSVLNTSQTPQKDTGIISKAIDYIFGL